MNSSRIGIWPPYRTDKTLICVMRNLLYQLLYVSLFLYSLQNIYGQEGNASGTAE